MSEVTWEGADVLREYLVPIDDLLDHEGNPRRGDVLALKGSLERFGQVRPILAEDGIIVAGHHLRYAAKELEWTHIAVIPHKFTDDVSRKAYLIADNYLAGLAGYDEQAQMSILEELEAQGELAGTGVTSDAIEDLRAAMEVVEVTVTDVWEGAGEADAETAARAAALAAYEPHREVPLSLTVEEFEDFGKYVRAIQSERGFTRMAEAVLYALEVAAVGASQRSVKVAEPTESDSGLPVVVISDEGVQPGTLNSDDSITVAHRVRVVFGDFMVDDEDAGYSCKLECSCGWERYAVHGEEAEKLKEEHQAAVLV